jgi:hypothetical protein
MLLPVLQMYFMCVQAVSDGVVGKAPNYLLSDTVAMLANWCSKVTSLPATTNRDLLHQLLDLLISKVQHSRKDVFKHNLELICTVVELWKPNFDIPYQSLYDLIMVSMIFKYLCELLDSGIFAR